MSTLLALLLGPAVQRGFKSQASGYVCLHVILLTVLSYSRLAKSYTPGVNGQGLHKLQQQEGLKLAVS